ncbi:ceramide kinase [Elysia marginata]|uniref:Ceramide kinase n=1 Tax=Elysia marginata TaxID=1093978 RepID=A0AAV4EXM6_9GAST|nr:ceramide kinase [Elysia marginata]
MIVVGGDGFYSEVLTAMVLRQQQVAGLNADDPDVEVSQLPVPVGMIPGGSGNFIPLYLHGTKDPVTAAIKVLMGKTTNSNVVGVYQEGKLQECAGLICSFGLLGDIMHECERFRWMGNFRYKVIPIRSIIGRRMIPGQVEYLHAPSGEWREVSGQFYGFDLNAVDLVDNGERLVPTFGPDSNVLHITSECSLGDHIKGLKKLEDWATGAYDFPFIQNEPVLRLRVTLDPTAAPTSRPTTASGAAAGDADTGNTGKDRPLDGVTYYINCDGEALPITRTRFEMRVHRNLVKLFGERPE